MTQTAFPPAPAEGAAPAETQSAHDPFAPPEGELDFSLGRKKLLIGGGVGAGVLVLGAAAFLLLTGGSGGDTSTSAPPVLPKPSVSSSTASPTGAATVPLPTAAALNGRNPFKAQVLAAAAGSSAGSAAAASHSGSTSGSVPGVLPGTNPSQPAAVQTITVPGPTVTQSVNVPGPTVTVTPAPLGNTVVEFVGLDDATQPNGNATFKIGGVTQDVVKGATFGKFFQYNGVTTTTTGTTTVTNAQVSYGDVLVSIPQGYARVF